MLDDLRIRDALPEDCGRLAALAGQLGYPCDARQVRERISPYLGGERCRIIVAEAGGVVVGWTSLDLVEHFYLDPFVEISGFVVDEGCRGRGIGKAIMDEAVEWARGKGCSLLRLKANALRKDAHRFYENYGFRKVKEQYVFVKDLGA